MNKEKESPKSFRFSIFKISKMREVLNKFSPTEKVVFYFFFVLCLVTSFLILSSLNKSLLSSVPDYGGKFNEGIIGSPRFINPLIAISDVDRDISSLVYSGLMKVSNEGKLEFGLAKKYTVSEDRLVYRFLLKDNIKFHDGIPVTSEDVEFTIQKTQDPILKSPRRGNWDGILVERISDKEIQFTLSQPYAPFIENTTIGIIPKHIWGNATSEEFAFSLFNTEPIGSGPYKITQIKRDSAGIPREYRLNSFKEYSLGEPYINEIILKFFPNEKSLIEAFEKKSIDSASGISPETIRSLEVGGSTVIKTTLPRIFGIFFNQNQAQVFSNPEVRRALDVALDKQRVISEVLYGYGRTMHGPIPYNWLFDINEPQTENLTSNPANQDERIAQAKDILEKAGWVMDENTGIYKIESSTANFSLEFSISTGDAPELIKAVNIIKEEWEKIGAKVTLSIFETGDLNQNIIRPRKYDSLFFGKIIGRDLDLYAFWHSSQRNDPGLNISMYANIETDKWLEEARIISDDETRKELYLKIQNEIKEDVPAVFVYSPNFLYLSSQKIKDINLENIITSSDRFSNIHNWYIETDKIWKIFIK